MSNGVDSLIKKYCPTPDDKQLAGPEYGPLQDSRAKMENHRTTAFIDGDAYFTAIYKEIDDLINTKDPQHSFFYMTAWWLGLAPLKGTVRVGFDVDLKVGKFRKNWEYDADMDGFPPDKSSGKTLLQLLKTIADKGIDVRVMPWVHPLIAFEPLARNSGIAGLNFQTLMSVSELRKVMRRSRVVLNLLTHPFAGAHCKMVICGDSQRMCAYTSGLDPVWNRWNPPGSQVDSVSYIPKDKPELKNACDALEKQTLTQPLFDTFKGPLRLPDYPNFLADVNRDFRVDPRFAGNEWKLTLFEFDSRTGQLETSILYLRLIPGQRIQISEFTRGGWHDVGVRVEGSAAGAIHGFFVDMWNEQLERKVETFRINGLEITSHEHEWEKLPTRKSIDLLPNTGQQYVQVLRTIPNMDFTATEETRGKLCVPDTYKLIEKAGKIGVKGHRIKWKFEIGVEELALPLGALAEGGVMGIYQRAAFSFAPPGRFEFKVALKKAISEAEQYIFIADQGLYGLEILDWINERMLKKPSLQVILLYGADPADPPNSFLAEAVNKHLIPRVPLDAKGHPKNVFLYEWTGSVVHSKVTIIDDTWCAIGSANCMRRSLYTDIELSISILEPPTIDNELPADWAEEANLPPGKKAPSFVQRLRRDLCAHYCGIPLDPAKRTQLHNSSYTALLKLVKALGIWDPRLPFRFSLRKEISHLSLNPFPVAGAFNPGEYDRTDPDSRQKF